MAIVFLCTPYYYSQYDRTLVTSNYWQTLICRSILFILNTNQNVLLGNFFLKLYFIILFYVLLKPSIIYPRNLSHNNSMLLLPAIYYLLSFNFLNASNGYDVKKQNVTISLHSHKNSKSYVYNCILYQSNVI